MIIEFFILTAILFMFPALSQLRIYLKTRIRAYAMLGMAFVMAALDSFLYGLIGIEIAFYMVPNQITYYMTYILMLLAIVDAAPAKHKVYILLFSFLSIIWSLISILSDILPREGTGIFMELFRVVMGTIMVYSISHGNFIIKKRHVVYIKYATMIIGVLLVLMGLIRGLYFVSFLCCDPVITWELMVLLSKSIFAVICVLAFVMAIFFPHLFLITFSQLLVAYHLHMGAMARNHGFTTETMLQEYMDNIPEEIMILLGKKDQGITY